MASPSSSLCPGYKQVDEFGPDDDYEEEEEEVYYVTLDMGNVEPTLVPSSSSYRLIGLDTPTPFIQLQGTVLKGRHDMLLGTELIFVDDKETHDRSKRSVVHVANTEQRIAFQEVTLIPKLSFSKGKEKANPEVSVNFEPSAEERSNKIDRMTGLSAPAGRAPRTRKASSNSKVAITGSRRAPSRTAQPHEDRTYSDDTGIYHLNSSRDDDMDDMYMDAE